MSQWYFNPVGNYPLAIGVALGLIVLSILVGVPRDRLTPGKRALLLVLRLAVLVLMLMALLRPALVHSTTKKQSATLALLVDRSRSMLVEDAFGGKSRWQALKSTLVDALPALVDLTDDLQVKIYTFDSQTQPLDFTEHKLDLDDQPQGEQTAIGAALEDILRREEGRRLLGVILLSDGAQRAYAPRATAPQMPARRLAELGCPLYTFTFGQARGQGQARDVAVKEFLLNPTVYVKNELVATGLIRTEGFANQKIPVSMLFEGSSGKDEVVATKELRPAKDGEESRVELSYVPQTPGEYRVTLRVEPQEGELATTNNELSTFVTVLTGGLNVLYLEGALRVEQKFLRRSLDASTDIKVDYIRLIDGDSKTRNEDLLQRFQKGKYDVYIIGDLDSSTFTGPELQALAATVADGAGLVMLGGYHTFGPGGYQKTPLADVLPIKMNDLERQRPGDAIRKDMHLAGPLKMRPAKPFGVRHFVMSLASAEANADAWDRLPPLEGANRFKTDGIKPSAQVLAETPKGDPVLVAQEAGGRVMAFAGDSTWHWWMGGFEQQHKQFWRQVILWLAHKDEVAEGSVWVRLAQRRFSPTSRVEFTTGAKSPQGQPVTDANFEATVIAPDGTRHAVHLSRQTDTLAGTFLQTLTPGDYTIEVTATQSGVPLGKAKSRFLVYAQDLELDNAAADPSLLASLAEMTKAAGGQSLAPEELPDLLERIKRQPLELEIEIERKDTHWDTWPFLLVFVGLLCVEWFLRKKWGLV